MGWSYRRSVKFGPFRLNLSKGGIGASVGVPGLRYGIGPRGAQLTAGLGGWRYQKRIGRAKLNRADSPPAQQSAELKAPVPVPIDGRVIKRVVNGLLIANTLLWMLVWGMQPEGAREGAVNPLTAFVVCTFLILAYFAPSLVADGRKHKSAGGILVINLLLGWTVLGWIVALAWAYADNGRRQPSIAPAE